MSTTETCRSTMALASSIGEPSAGTQLPHPASERAQAIHHAPGGDPATQAAMESARPEDLPLSGSTLPRPTIGSTYTRTPASGGDTHSVTDHRGGGTHVDPVGHGPSSTASQERHESQTGLADRGSTSALDRHPDGAQVVLVEGGINTQQAIGQVSAKDPSPAGADAERDRAAMVVMEPRAALLFDPALAFAADILDDTEGLWVANSNRLRTLTTAADQADADGVCRGFGLTEAHPDVARLAAMVATLEQLTKDATKHLEKVMRRHPLHPWVKAQKGLGDKQTARLLAAIGDPYWNTLHNRPRTVSELWAYCGFHVLPASHPTPENHAPSAGRAQAGESGGRDHFPAVAHSRHVGVAPRRQRGRKANWSETARKRAWLIANSVVKAGGPYREVYDATKEKYADGVHTAVCIRCGPSGKPAQTGSPLSKAHVHARGLRAISKAVLKDLWIEAKRLHEPPVSDQSQVDNPQTGRADRAPN